jgi:hypothetical protein
VFEGGDAQFSRTRCLHHHGRTRQVPQQIWHTISARRSSEGRKQLVDLHLPNPRLCITSRPEADVRVASQAAFDIPEFLNDERGQRKDIIDCIQSVVRSELGLRMEE